MRLIHRVPFGLLFIAIGPLPIIAQPAKLTAPNASIAEPFSAVRGARELPGGRLLLTDYRDQRVVIVDFGTKKVTTRIVEGGGPLEARLPTGLIPAPGDSIVLRDVGNQRLMMLSPEGRPVRILREDHAGIMGVRGVDARGRFYFTIPAWQENRPLPADSVRLVRFDPGVGEARTVARILGDRYRSDMASPSRVPRMPIVGYASQDGWAVGARDVWIVRANSYQIERIAEDGRSTVGPSYRYSTPLVSATDRLAFVREFNASSPTSSRGEGSGAMQHSPTMQEQEIAAMAKGTEFAARHPMFDPNRVLLAPGDELWVGLPTLGQRPSVYHRFDRSGRRVGEVALAVGCRIVAVGSEQIYVVRVDPDGLEFLERYSRPPG